VDGTAVAAREQRVQRRRQPLCRDQDLGGTTEGEPQAGVEQKHPRERGRGGGHRRRGGGADGKMAPACERRAERQRRRRPCGIEGQWGAAGGVEQKNACVREGAEADTGGHAESRGNGRERCGLGLHLQEESTIPTKREGFFAKSPAPGQPSTGASAQARVGTGRGRCRRGRSWCEERAGSFNIKDSLQVGILQQWHN
jgi:hypothetical protein